MDILNFISWIASKRRVVTSVPDNALVPVGIRTEPRDDKYTTVAIKKSDLITVPEPTYKVYTALLTQIGTSAPVAIVLENTIGNIVWDRDTTGEYLATLLGAFTNNKTYLMINQTSSGENTFSVVDVDRLSLITYNSSGAAQDNKLNKTSIEIRVYN